MELRRTASKIERTSVATNGPADLRNPREQIAK
jgi:hypothetical protein